MLCLVLNLVDMGTSLLQNDQGCVGNGNVYRIVVANNMIVVERPFRATITVFKKLVRLKLMVAYLCVILTWKHGIKTLFIPTHYPFMLCFHQSINAIELTGYTISDELHHLQLCLATTFNWVNMSEQRLCCTLYTTHVTSTSQWKLRKTNSLDI